MLRRRFLALAGGFLEYPCAVHALSAPPLRRIRLVNAHTKETFDGPYRDDLGPIGLAIEELSLLLRDHHSGEQIAIDISVIDFLTALMEAIGASRATVLSAYRGVATNRALARTAFGVADNSQHLYGRALDIRFDTRLEEAVRNRLTSVWPAHESGTYTVPARSLPQRQPGSPRPAPPQGACSLGTGIFTLAASIRRRTMVGGR